MSAANLSLALRNLARRIMAESNRTDESGDNYAHDDDARRMLMDGAECASVLARIIEGRDVRRAFGAPGDWGYDTAIGQGLYEFLCGRANDGGPAP